MQISKYISFNEATKSPTAIKLGIKNIPPLKVLENMKLIGGVIFDKIRIHFGVPIGINSFYRCAELNTAIGGSVTSQHVSGEAIDIDADMYGKITNKQIFDYIKDKLDFDQLIWEFGTDENPDWVHVSYSKIKNRKQVIRAKKVAKKTVYVPY